MAEKRKQQNKKDSASEEQKGTKKLDTSVIVALIGAGATIIAAIIGITANFFTQQSNIESQTSTPPVEYLYVDDFSSGISNYFPTEPIENEYAIETRKIDIPFYSWDLTIKKGVVAVIYLKNLPSVSNFDYTLNLHKVSGDVRDYGLQFRVNDGGYYWFGINSEGKYAFAKRIKGEPSSQYNIPWKDLPNISLQDFNELRVVANSNRFQFYVNDNLVDNAIDDTFQIGTVAVYATINHQNKVLFEIKNFSLAVLPP